MNEKKICFVICTNNDIYLQECLCYISELEVPEGYEVDVISIQDAKSMAAGYNEAMRATDAKYKVYLHQDVFIVYKGFIQAILDIFASDEAIGMIGMVGTPKMSPSGVMWWGHREGSLYGAASETGKYSEYKYSLQDGLHEVEAVDGLMMITSKDIPWREDVFDGWDFYDVSQSFEFRRGGYRVVVPEQKNAWCVHDDGVLNLRNYDRYRKICMREYGEYFEGYDNFTIRKKGKRDVIGQLRLFIIAKDQKKEVQDCISILINNQVVIREQIIVVDNGSDDGLRNWLSNETDIEYISSRIVVPYSMILNVAYEQFIDYEDVFIMTPLTLLERDTINVLIASLYRDEQVGIVCANVLKSNVLYPTIICDKSRKLKECYFPFVTAVMIKNELWVKNGRFDEKLANLHNVFLDYAMRAEDNGYDTLLISKALGYDFDVLHYTSFEEEKYLQTKYKEIIDKPQELCDSFRMFVVGQTGFYPMPLDYYVPIQTGSLRTGIELGVLTDDTADNIAYKNINYCELTALYWIWKNYASNCKDEYIGFCHYRRLFNGGDSENSICRGDVNMLLADNDFILPQYMRFQCTSRQLFLNTSGYAQDLDSVEAVIKREYPRYFKAWKNRMNADGGHYCNMFITSVSNFCEYCGWLFELLEKVEKKVNLKGYCSYKERFFGFIGEFMLDVWINTNNKTYVEIPSSVLEKIE